MQSSSRRITADPTDDPRVISLVKTLQPEITSGACRAKILHGFEQGFLSWYSWRHWARSIYEPNAAQHLCAGSTNDPEAAIDTQIERAHCSSFVWVWFCSSLVWSQGSRCVSHSQVRSFRQINSCLAQGGELHPIFLLCSDVRRFANVAEIIPIAPVQ